ncbi:MAG: hypothetical protein WBR33_09665 [Pseudonocardiaceae bacterium]
MHFPSAVVAGDPGVLAAVGVERLAVVGAVADLDAVGVDDPPGRRQQLDVIVGAQWDGNVTGDLDQRRVLLIRCQCLARGQRVAKPVVGPVLPVRHDPLVEQVLQLGDRPDRVLVGVVAASIHAATDVAGDVLGEQGGDRAEGALYDALGPRRRLHLIPTIGTVVCG